MRPLAVLIGIVMGSAFSIALGLGMVLIIFLILAAERAELAAEFGPLLRALGLFCLLSAAAGASFFGELRGRSWRRLALGALGVSLILVVWVYWPRPQ
ncbi:MAG: hypothetical protein HC872_00935 [Gammaproteobacteria bacterium]|nr:hypothetical protein [Gammaproteobacteria bacterium]